MNSNGALQPHLGAPAIGSSLGVKRYRDKRYQSHDNTLVSILKYSGYNKSDQRECNNYNNCSNRSTTTVIGGNSNRSVKRRASLEQMQQQEKKVPEEEEEIVIKEQQQQRKQRPINTQQPQQSHKSSQSQQSKQSLQPQPQQQQRSKISLKNQVQTNFETSIFSNSHMQGYSAVVSEGITFKNRLLVQPQPVTADAASRNVTTPSTSAIGNNPIFYARLVTLLTIVGAAVAGVAEFIATIFVSVGANMANRIRFNVANEVMRMQQSLSTVLTGASMRSVPIHATSRLSGLFLVCLLYATVSLPTSVRCDDFFVNSFSSEPEPTTPIFDYASRGQKKFGDKCENTLECGFPGSICDPKKKSCQCTEDLPVTNHIDKCGKEAAVNESCFFNEQCEVKYFQTECRNGKCECRFEMMAIWGKDGTVECKGRQDKRGTETYIDPAMIGVLVGMALMFVIICVVLRLFSQARWRENRTIFNTPNPRLMNVSLLRDSKLLHGQERRGSRMSVRAPSRQPSMASLRPHSPNPSLGKTGSHSGSRGSGHSASATSLRSTRSNSVAPGNITNSQHERKGSTYVGNKEHVQNQQQQLQHQQSLITNITSNPAAESITVEIIEPQK